MTDPAIAKLVDTILLDNPLDLALKQPEPDVEVVVTELVQQPNWMAREEIQVRGLIYADAALDRQMTDVQTKMAAVMALYKAKWESLEARQTFIRRSIEAYLILSKKQKVSWPDVGVAFMAKNPDKLEIVDEKRLKDILHDHYEARGVRIIHEIDKKEVRKMVEETGDTFDGTVTLRPQPQSLRIRHEGGNV